MFLSAAVVDQDAMPSGREPSTSERIEMRRSFVSTSTTFSESIQHWRFVSVTRTRRAYHFPLSKLMYRVVSLFAASWPSRLDSPTTPPPQPPTMKLHGSSFTGKVRAQKKSL